MIELLIHPVASHQVLELITGGDLQMLPGAIPKLYRWSDLIERTMESGVAVPHHEFFLKDHLQFARLAVF